MKALIVLTLGAAFIAGTASADPKEDLVKAIVEQCKLPEDKAQSLATPGRAGTVVQFAVCTASPVDVGEGCKVVCKKSGSNIGG